MEDHFKAEQARYPMPPSIASLVCGIISLIALCFAHGDESSYSSYYSSSSSILGYDWASSLGNLLVFAPFIIVLAFGIILNTVSLLAKSKGCALAAGILYTLVAAPYVWSLFGDAAEFKWYFVTIFSAAVLPYAVYIITNNIEGWY